MIPIYVPTYGRTEKELPVLNTLGTRAILVVRPEEADHYKRRAKVWVLPRKIKHVGQTRHFIVTNSPHPFVWMVDDDVTTKNILEGIDDTQDEMVRVKADLGCVGSAFMANVRQEKDGDFTYNRFGNAAWCVRKKVYLKNKVDMSLFKTSEDMYCWLKLMMRGSKSVMYNRVLVRKREGQKGGCATYRTAEQVRADMEKLEQMFSPYYKLMPSRFKSQSYHLGVAARVSWAKLAADKIEGIG